MLSDLFSSGLEFEVGVEILERMVAVDVNGSGFDCVIDGEFSVLPGGDEPVGVEGESSGPFLYRRDRRIDANLSNPSLVPAPTPSWSSFFWSALDSEGTRLIDERRFPVFGELVSDFSGMYKTNFSSE